jgi:subtilisin family serine protease
MDRRRILIMVLVLLIVISIILASISILSMVVPVANGWAVQVTQIDRLHALGFYGAGVTIGIVDTGVDSTHQEFDESSFIAWHDSMHQRSAYYDDSDHGTHVAGLLVSKGSFEGLLSGINMQGIAPEVQVIMVKAVPQDQYFYSTGNDTIIAQGIQFCIEQGADIILLSSGKNPQNLRLNQDSMVAAACLQALEQGIFVVAPAGNDGHDDDGDVAFPGVLDGVIAVGSIGSNSLISAFSSQGHQYLTMQHPHKKPELVAPGERIVSTRVHGGYGEISGTSQAATYVAGVLALLLDAYPEYKHDGTRNQNATTISLFKEILAVTAAKIGSLEADTVMYSHDDVYGYGLIQAYDAYTKLADY